MGTDDADRMRKILSRIRALPELDDLPESELQDVYAAIARDLFPSNPFAAYFSAMFDPAAVTEPEEGERLERFSARLSKAQKSLLERAAEIQDRTLTDFVLSAAQAEAERVVRDRMTVTLSAMAFDAFADACIGATDEPNEALRGAAARQKKRVVS